MAQPSHIIEVYVLYYFVNIKHIQEQQILFITIVKLTNDLVQLCTITIYVISNILQIMHNHS